MSLSATRLALALTPTIQSAFVSSGAVLGPALTALSTNLASAIATAVVTEITTNALVPALGLVAPSGGGPCTGATTVT